MSKLLESVKNTVNNYLFEIGDTFKGRRKLKSYVKKSKKDEGDIHIAQYVADRHASEKDKERHNEKASGLLSKRIIGQYRAKKRLAKKK